DADALSAMVRAAYTGASLSPKDVDTGAVILTGAAAARANAPRIVEALAADSGRFVSATAGHHLEAALAAHGSGAVALSRKGGAVLNVDIGGATTKLALCVGGRVGVTSALAVGSRAKGHAAELAEQLLHALEHHHEAEDLPWLTEPFHTHERLAGIVFSGGVSEYIYEPGTPEFGDLGRELGAAIRARLGELPAPVQPAVERIRATVFGASQSTLQLSGNRVVLPNRRALPLRNLPVLAISRLERIGADVARAHRRLDLTEGAQKVALALPRMSAEDAATVAEALGEAMPCTLANRLPLIVIADGAPLLAQAIGERAAVIAVEGLELREYDYVDLGAPLQPSGRVPVTVKSLVFPSPHT
ncbi:MAG: ethanolamine ammonia-lyase reactivating factor EutA, partial [Chloroflexi bacterium]|nr:ethanolamine ammonia-lyase reactivating factor EutA [Chloroflexota bacterium]